MLTYDVTNVNSLNEVRTWMEVLQHHKLDKADRITLVLIGCKSDLEHLRTVRLDSHTRFAQEYGIPLSFIVSAKSGESVRRNALLLQNKTLWKTKMPTYKIPKCSSDVQGESLIVPLFKKILRPH